MLSLNRMAAAASVAVACSFATHTPVLAQASGDGWLGPRVFDDTALDQSLQAMNGFLQARYASDDLMASLNGEPEQADFVTVARTVSDVPELTGIRVESGFGPAVVDGRSLDLQLAAFSEDQLGRGEPLFVRIALTAGGLDFADVADVPPVRAEAAFGPEIWDDRTLDEHMLALFDQMLEHAERNAALSVASPDASTGSSFDRYATSLTLY
jgi:hypothetical protein